MKSYFQIINSYFLLLFLQNKYVTSYLNRILYINILDFKTQSFFMRVTALREFQNIWDNRMCDKLQKINFIYKSTTKLIYLYEF